MYLCACFAAWVTDRSWLPCSLDTYRSTPRVRPVMLTAPWPTHRGPIRGRLQACGAEIVITFEGINELVGRPDQQQLQMA